MRAKGTKIFSIIYNMLGLFTLGACCKGFVALAQSRSLIIGDQDYAQMAAIVVTVLFFASSYLLTSRRKEGYLIPIFLLSFTITGGFVLLLPLFAAHVIFFTHPRVSPLFV